MIHRYVGSGPYCYSNTLVMALQDPALTPTLVETLTGSPFGYQLLFDERPLFDPFGWDPNMGLDQALRLLGYAWETRSFDEAGEAMDALQGELVEHAPVFVGPVDMGLLAHQPGSDRASGADHFVAVLAVENNQVIMHDPQGHPWAALPTSLFRTAWRADEIAYGESFTMRTGFTKVQDCTPEESLHALLPEAAAWVAGRDLPVPPRTTGGAEALQRMAEQVRDEFGDDRREILTQFSIRVGARRREDAATCMASIGRDELATNLQAQAKALGALQYPALMRHADDVADGFDRLAQLHSDLEELLGRG